MTRPSRPWPPTAAARRANLLPLRRDDVAARSPSAPAEPADHSARKPAPVRDLLASLGF